MSFQGLCVLAVAPIRIYGGFNTSIHRLESMRRLGIHVEEIDTFDERSGDFARWHYRVRNWLFKKGLPLGLPDITATNQRLLKAASCGHWDLLWIDKGLNLNEETFAKFRRLQPNCVIAGFSPDDMGSRHNLSFQFLRSMKWYDVFFTTKSYNVAELSNYGCRRVVFIPNGYDPNTFRPLLTTEQDIARLGGDVGFIGTWEQSRAESMRYLAESGISLRVWGGSSWEQMPKPPAAMKLEYQHLYRDDYALACQAFKINLCFLRKINRDLQTTRSVEIPACGGFMLAERTNEHLDLFKEGEEAEFFSSDAELLEKCRYYLEHENERIRIARNGLQRCLDTGYSNDARIDTMLKTALEQRTVL